LLVPWKIPTISCKFIEPPNRAIEVFYQSNYRKRPFGLMKLFPRLLACISLLTIVGTSPAKADSGSSMSTQANAASQLSKSKLEELAEKYIAFSFESSPTSATDSGVHTYDHALEDYSKQAILKELAYYENFLKEIETVPLSDLTLADQIDLHLLKNDCQSRLLQIKEIRGWQRNPDLYSSLASASIYSLIKRDFAPAKIRLAAAISREKAISALLNAGKENLVNPPQIYTKIALEQLPGTINFFRNDVPTAFADVKDQGLQEEFQAVNQKAIKDLEDYQSFLKQTLLPKSKGSFALGSALYARKLLYDEMVTTPVDQLLAIGEAELRRLQSEFVKTAKEIDPAHTPREVLDSCAKDHPKADQLLNSIQAELAGLKQYCLDHSIVSMPTTGVLKVAETPPFMRATTFAAMDTPGPFETKAREAFYYATIPEKNWTAEHIEEHLREFSKGTIITTSVHEAYPGHYVQFLWQNTLPSKVRKLFGCGSNSEGWAHYCEQMMIDEGLGGGDKRLRLVQLQEALLRACRYVVAIKLHTQGMTLKQAIDFFVKEGYMEKANADREAKRGTEDPTYLVYTLGKLEILKLRDDYKQLKGASFSLKDFHDRFLQEGSPPLPLVRAALLDQERGNK
jgi:uncharacterized protein (DUF885 family)